MQLGEVVGTVVSTRKDPKLSGSKLIIVRAIDTELRDDPGAYWVAVDTVQAGFGETVLVVTGSSARMTEATRDAPVDAAVVAIVDTVSIDGDAP